MRKLQWYFNRLRSMGAAEIAWRVRSLCRDVLDLVRLPLKLYPRLGHDVYQGFRTLRPGFTLSPQNAPSGAVSGVPNPTWERRLLDKADRVLENRLTYFNLVDHFHGDPFDWHRDHSANVACPLRLSTLLDYRDFQSVGDCKLVWEPNRHHQLVVLARAYKVSGKLVYANKIVELLDSWLAANPFGYGMNWKSPLEVGIRLINWVYAIDLIRTADVFPPRVWAETLQAIYLACWDVQRKFSRGSSANNHLIGEAAGVYIAASYFPEFDDAARWRRDSKAILEREILAQTHNDGCTLECAFGYQLFVLQFLSVCSLVGQRTGDEFSTAFHARLHRMYRFMMDISHDTGRPPTMGDSDDGYVLDLGELPDKPQQLLSVGRYLFDDPSLGGGPPSETVYWLFGHGDTARSEASRHMPSIAYPESGYYLLRSNHSVESGARVSVFADCAELGFGPIAAHGHADCLSFVLNFGNRPVLVDPGTYDYFSYPDWRDYFRHTAAHNSAVVDGYSQSESVGPFMWRRRANPRVIDWRDDEHLSLLCAEHDGYGWLDDPVVHRRTIELHKSALELVITDQFDAASVHEATLHFHVHPDCPVSHTSSREASISVGDATLALCVPDGRLDVKRASETERLGWVSHAYHAKRPSACIVVDIPVRGKTKVVTRLYVR